MATKFDRIVIAVPSLSAAVEQYQPLFGTEPLSRMTLRGEPSACWRLPNTAIELVESAVERPCLQGIRFYTPEAECGERSVPNSLGLDIRLCDGSAVEEPPRQRSLSKWAELSVDHLVLRTDDPQGCIDLFAGELGIRLALDKTVPEWGGRMLFFRAGKLTLEVIASQRDTSTGSFFWGLAYQCPDLARLVKKLGSRGVAVSDIREGRKPGTLVATLKSHSLEIPTLLIQPAK